MKNFVNAGSNPGDMLYWNGTKWAKVPAYSGPASCNPTLNYNGGVPAWQTCTYAIGDHGPSGYMTKVFYVESGQHGLEAWMDDEGGGTTYTWANAVTAAASHGPGWHLPSKDELAKLYANQLAVGGFATSTYWSSTQLAADIAWYQNVASGFQYSGNKLGTFAVRAVRAF